jgi:hypothetical protein
MPDQPNNNLPLRAIKLMQDPTIHDPEALRIILASMQKLKSMATVSSMIVAGTVRAAVELLEQDPEHLEHCGVSRAVYDILKAAAAISGDTGEHRVAAYTGQSVEKADGFHSRIVNAVTGDVVAGPFGPFTTEPEALEACEKGMRTMLTAAGLSEDSAIGIPIDNLAPKSRAVH